MTSKRVMTGLRLPIWINDKLTESASEAGMTKNGLMTKILTDWIESKEKEGRGNTSISEKEKDGVVADSEKRSR